MQKVFFGSEVLNALKKEIFSSPGKKIFLVHGKNSYIDSGAEDFIASILKENKNFIVKEFSDFSSNPKYEDLIEGIKQCNLFNPDSIVSIGGGSVLDMSKLIRFFCAIQGDMFHGIYKATGELKPLIAIPTTAGTGAETTCFAVLYKDNIKHSIEDLRIQPDMALIYPKLTNNCSRYLTACSGFDALAQAIESYWNINATAESDSYAEKAMNLIIPNLVAVVKQPNENLREKMAMGAYWAGRAINITKTTAPHAFSYPFTSFYGYPHGHAVALCFPYLAEYNFEYGNIPINKIRYLSNKFCTNECDIKSKFLDITHSIGLGLKPGNYDVETLLKGININRLSNNPAKIEIATSRHLLNKILTQTYND